MTYNEFINNIIETRGQWSEEVFTSDRGCEKHHIVPACLEGKGDVQNEDGKWSFSYHSHHENCIYLYPAEHFKAHYYLAKDCAENDSLCYALNSMITRQTNKMKKDLYINLDLSADEYEEARILAREANSRAHTGIKQTKERIENRANKNRGQHRTVEQRKRQSEAAQKRDNSKNKIVITIKKFEYEKYKANGGKLMWNSWQGTFKVTEEMINEFKERSKN